MDLQPEELRPQIPKPADLSSLRMKHGYGEQAQARVTTSVSSLFSHHYRAIVVKDHHRGEALIEGLTHQYCQILDGGWRRQAHHFGAFWGRECRHLPVDPPAVPLAQ